MAFCEVKLKGDPLRHEQVQTLAFLRDLLGATMEVGRLVPEGQRVKNVDAQLEAKYRLR